MITYMPFTHIGEPQLRLLTGALGALTIHSPAAELVPEHMRDWQARNLLDIRHPQAVDGDRLRRAIREYKSWADLHEGDIAEMAGFVKYRQERFAMMDETNPTRISHQVRHYGAPPERESADPLLQAALFLSLAQEFDEQHQAMDRQMDDVETMEQQMVQQLSGGMTGDGDEWPMRHTQPPTSHDLNMDSDMMSLRVRAWSLVARNDTATNPGMYLTTSRAAFDVILERFPDAQEVYNQGLFTLENEPMVPVSRMREIVETLMDDPGSQLADGGTHPDASLKNCGQRLTIYRLGGVPPHGFLTAIGDADRHDAAAGQDGGGTSNTLVALVVAQG